MRGHLGGNIRHSNQQIVDDHANRDRHAAEAPTDTPNSTAETTDPTADTTADAAPSNTPAPVPTPSTTDTVTSPPTDNTFASGHTYDGGGTITLAAGSYPVQSNTIIRGYTFEPGAVPTFDASPDCVEITNNMFKGGGLNPQALVSLRGSNLTITYNTFAGIAMTEGYLDGANYDISHNLIEHTPLGADAVHLFFGAGGDKAFAGTPGSIARNVDDHLQQGLTPDGTRSNCNRSCRV